jgi:hypothetical protein
MDGASLQLALINECLIPCFNPNKQMEHYPWVGQVNGKRAGGNRDTCRRMPVAYAYVLGQGACWPLVMEVSEG